MTSSFPVVCLTQTACIFVVNLLVICRLVKAETAIPGYKDSSGSVRGQSITPLFPSIVKNVTEDPDFYALLSIVDSIRIGKSRERNTAIELLDKYLQNYGSEK